MDGNAIANAVMRYMAAWNEPAASGRHALLEQCWSDGGVYVDPKVSPWPGVKPSPATSPRFRPGGPAHGLSS
ncbi:hypothetical protein ACFIOY_14520 [Bradyrhizobium sp. TZ2]